MDKSNVTIKPDRPVTPKKYLANYCIENPHHLMFKATNGARCVEYNSLVNVKEVTMAEHYSLPTYTELRKSRNEKPSKSLSISVDVNTDKMQLKLRAIAKHTEALVDELDAIDAIGDEVLKTAVSIGKTTSKSGEDIADALKDFPTRLEGSY